MPGRPTCLSAVDELGPAGIFQSQQHWDWIQVRLLSGGRRVTRWLLGACWESSSTTRVGSSTSQRERAGAGRPTCSCVVELTGRCSPISKPANTGAYDHSCPVSGGGRRHGGHRAYSEDSGTAGVNSTPNEGAPDAGAALRVHAQWDDVGSGEGLPQSQQHRRDDSFGYSVGVSGDIVCRRSNLEDSSMMSVNSNARRTRHRRRRSLRLYRLWASPRNRDTSLLAMIW